MKADQDQKIVIIGLGYLMEYIAPCYKRLLGENLASNVVGVTADAADVERKEKAIGIRVILNDNLKALREMEPDFIFFAPPPSVAPGLTDAVLVPYFQELRQAGKPIPTLYVFPPNPVGKFYMDKLGSDLKVVNILPNMINEIAGQNVTAAGFTMITFPDDQDNWKQEDLDFLRRFWAPLGNAVFLNPAQVKAALSVSCSNQMLSEIFYDVADITVGTAHQVTAAQLGEAARAYHLQKRNYEPAVYLESRLDAVTPQMLEAVKKLTFHAYEGTVKFLEAKGFPKELAFEIQNMNFDMNLRKVQMMSRTDLARATRKHATRGGVLECACISYTQRWQDDVKAKFAQYPAWTPDAAWAEALEQGFQDMSQDVYDHLENLADKPKTAHCGIEQHATMYAMLVRQAVLQAGQEGRAAMSEATAVYGLERGGRMRQRALTNGDTPNALSYMAYGEWGAEPGTMIVEELKDRKLYFSHVYKCEWCRWWKKHGLLEYGKAYCENVDVNIAHGFDPEFHLQVNSLLSAGAPYCEFGYGFELTDEKREQLAEMQQRLGDSAKRDFDYHVAHLYYTCRKVLVEKLGGSLGTDVADAAFFDFTRRFGAPYATAVAAYAGEDFTKV